MRESDFQTTVEILLVEDNPDDAFILRNALKRGSSRKVVHVVETGEEALRFLHREAPYQRAPRPRLVLLDLRLPGMSGLEVLRVLHDEAALRPIPVVVLSQSSDDDDVLAAYDEHARAFITKPTDRTGFEAMIERIEAFWLGTAQLPQD